MWYVGPNPQKCQLWLQQASIGGVAMGVAERGQPDRSYCVPIRNHFTCKYEQSQGCLPLQPDPRQPMEGRPRLRLITVPPSPSHNMSTAFRPPPRRSVCSDYFVAGWQGAFTITSHLMTSIHFDAAARACKRGRNEARNCRKLERGLLRLKLKSAVVDP